MRLTALPLLLVTLIAVSTGCSSYVLQGRVVHGAANDMAFVAGDDARLADAPVPSARISVYRDPDKLSRKMSGTGLSDAHGVFSIQIDELGAGWMDEEWLVQASKAGYRTASAKQRLTGGTKKMQLLIIMAPGAADAPREDDLLKQYERFK